MRIRCPRILRWACRRAFWSTERLLPSNKRLKLPVSAGAGSLCYHGCRAGHKEVLDSTRCGGSRRSLGPGRYAAAYEDLMSFTFGVVCTR